MPSDHNLWTPLALVYEILILQNHALSHYFCTTLQLHNLPVDNARELFIPWKDSASLLVCNEKYLSTGFQVFSGWYHKWNRFKPFWVRLSSPGPQLHEGRISLKILVETRLKSWSFEPLIGSLRFLVLKLR